MRYRMLPFNSFWVTTVTVVTYAILGAIVVWVHESSPAAPSSADALSGGIDLEQAWQDLQTIAARPHPYNSLESDSVRDYLLRRVRTLEQKYPSLHVADDLVSNTAFVEYKRVGFYFEGSNVLVKVDGRNETLPAALFSAHFDSSALAPGATDDGMGVVSLLSLMEHLAKDPPLRTTIFNLNNGEEDGLCGAHAFLQHAWSKEAGFFLNLEGAGSGGRPILFRGSTAALVKTFQSTSRPHGTVTSSDAYALGLIKSITDYEVYAGEGGLKGLDVSFYVNRDKYHTMQDTVTELEDLRALWSDLRMTTDVGASLANLAVDEVEDQESAVYWDVLGRRMIVLPFSTFARGMPRLTVMTTLLVVALKAALWYTGNPIKPRGAWLHLPLSLSAGIASLSMLGFLYCKLNPLIVYSSSYSVIISLSSGVILSNLLPLWYLQAGAPEETKSLMWSQYFIFMLVLQAGYSEILRRSHFTGFYFLQWLFGGAAFGAIADSATCIWRQQQARRNNGRSYDAIRDEASTEPLLEMSRLDSQEGDNTSPPPRVAKDTKETAPLWVLESLLGILPSLLLVSPLVLVIAAGLGQTIVDGSAAVLVYGGITVLLFLCFIPLVPFAHQLSSRFFLFIGLVFLGTTFYNFMAFPFTADRKAKFFYTQDLDLDTGKATVELMGVQPFVTQALRSIPSAKNTEDPVRWSVDPERGLGVAKWLGPLPNLGNVTELTPLSNLQELVVSSARRVDAETAVFIVKGIDTKSCVIRFDQNVVDVRTRRLEGSLVKKNGISGQGLGIIPDTPYSMPPGGIPVVTLWSREWDQEFEVTVKWNATAALESAKGSRAKFSWRSLLPFGHRRWPTYTGRIGCQWHDNSRSNLVALNELFEHLPTWATLTVKKPLVTADRAFSV